MISLLTNFLGTRLPCITSLPKTGTCFSPSIGRSTVPNRNPLNLDSKIYLLFGFSNLWYFYFIKLKLISKNKIHNSSHNFISFVDFNYGGWCSV